MPETAQATLNLTEAAKLARVSRGRLYRAIEDGRLEAMPGGGPGKPTMLSREALQTFCQREGLQIPEAVTVAERSERLERPERSIMQTPAATDHLIERLADRVVDRLTQRFTEDLRAMLAPVVEDLVHQSVERLSKHIERSMERLTAERSLSRPETFHERSTPPHTTAGRPRHPPASHSGSASGHACRGAEHPADGRALAGRRGTHAQRTRGLDERDGLPIAAGGGTLRTFLTVEGVTHNGEWRQRRSYEQEQIASNTRPATTVSTDRPERRGRTDVPHT